MTFQHLSDEEAHRRAQEIDFIDTTRPRVPYRDPTLPENIIHIPVKLGVPLSDLPGEKMRRSRWDSVGVTNDDAE